MTEQWTQGRPNPRWFRKRDAQRFVRGSIEILVVKRFDSIAVQPHAVLIVGCCQPIRFRTFQAAERAANQIEGIRRRLSLFVTYEEAVGIWRKRRAEQKRKSQEKHPGPRGRPRKLATCGNGGAA